MRGVSSTKSVTGIFSLEQAVPLSFNRCSRTQAPSSDTSTVSSLISKLSRVSEGKNAYFWVNQSFTSMDILFEQHGIYCFFIPHSLTSMDIHQSVLPNFVSSVLSLQFSTTIFLLAFGHSTVPRWTEGEGYKSDKLFTFHQATSIMHTKMTNQRT